MLRSFRVANHKSIKDEVDLSLLPAYDKSIPALPVAAIFGANASGKSNLLDALFFAQTAVRRSYADWEPRAGVPRTPFRLDPDFGRTPSLYVVDVELTAVRYTYGFAVDDDQVTEEWLYSYPHRKKRVIFERDGQRIEVGSTVRARDLPAVRNNALLLSAAARAEVVEVGEVYEWFRAGLRSPSAAGSHVPPTVAERLADGGDAAHQLVSLVRAADFGITDIEVTEENSPPMRSRLRAPLPGLREIPGELLFRHGSGRVAFTLEDESEGTRTWIRLVEAALSTLEDGSVLAVDEIDASLHPRLTARLIEVFRDRRTNPSGAQLIFTTHDATLLGTSFGAPILGRDEVWFVDKDEAGATTLFSLADFKPRKEENTERRYLGGSYGAVPAVFSDTLVEQLLEARREPSGVEA